MDHAKDCSDLAAYDRIPEHNRETDLPFFNYWDEKITLEKNRLLHLIRLAGETVAPIGFISETTAVPENH